MSRKRSVNKTSKIKNKNFKIILLTFIIIIIAFAGIYSSSILQEPPISKKSWGDAPDFTLKTIYGDDFTLSDQLGKIIVLDFMASWCYWCSPQMDELLEVNNLNSDEILIVSVDVEKGETIEDLKTVFEDYLDKWIFVFDDYNENVGSKYQVSGIPKLVIVNKEGNIYYSDSGLTESEKIIEEINKANNI